MSTLTQCKIEGCDTKIIAKGMCHKHYARQRKGKDPSVRTSQEMSPEEKLKSRLLPPDPVTGCIEWSGSKMRFGYGVIHANGKDVAAHRLSWILKHGPIPEGVDVLHRCDNPPCCNEEHLFLGTDSDNALDKKLKGRAAKKLTALDIPEIRRLLEKGERQEIIAKRFGVNKGNISAIKQGKIWSHVS